MSEISNVTKQDVALRLQRNEEFRLKMKLRIPNSTSYYDISGYNFSMRVVDSAGNVKFDFLNNRFGRATIYESELIISKAESDSLLVSEVYYYDLKVINADGIQKYWLTGTINPADRITP